VNTGDGAIQISNRKLRERSWCPWSYRWLTLLFRDVRRVLKRQTSQVRNTKTEGHAQPKRMAIEVVSPVPCDGPLVALAWEANAHPKFRIQPVATAIAAVARPFNRERDRRSQKTTTGIRSPASSRALVMNVSMMNRTLKVQPHQVVPSFVR